MNNNNTIDITSWMKMVLTTARKLVFVEHSPEKKRNLLELCNYQLIDFSNSKT